MGDLVLRWLVAQTPVAPVGVQWTVLGILAAVLGAVGLEVRRQLERADRRLDMNEEIRLKERERDLAMQERLTAALLTAAQADQRSADIIGRAVEGITELRLGIERQEEAVRRLEGLMR